MPGHGDLHRLAHRDLGALERVELRMGIHARPHGARDLGSEDRAGQAEGGDAEHHRSALGAQAPAAGPGQLDRTR